MRRIPFFARFLALTVLLSACGSEGREAGHSTDPTIGGYFDIVRDVFSGENALQAVAAVEGTVRVPRNEGIDAAIHGEGQEKLGPYEPRRKQRKGVGGWWDGVRRGGGVQSSVG